MAWIEGGSPACEGQLEGGDDFRVGVQVATGEEEEGVGGSGDIEGRGGGKGRRCVSVTRRG